MASNPKRTRRDFLVGRSALEAIAELPSRLLPDDPESPVAAAIDRTDSSYLVQIARTAMACEFQVFLNAGQHDGGVETALRGLDRVEEIEDQLTVYRPHSEVTQLNRRAANEQVVVEAGLLGLLQTSIRLYGETGGAFDITAGPLTKIWGFHRREGSFPSQQTIDDTLRQVGSHRLVLDAHRSTVRFQRRGVEINFGGIGKGYALDQAGEMLRSGGVEDFLIQGGRSSVLAAGSRNAGEQQGWRIALRHPLRHEIRLADVTLRDRALGTSGSGNQFFHFAGRRYGHVLDPRSGYPADKVLSATVLAPTATMADALATAFFVMGVEASIEFCESRPELAVILVCHGQQPGSVAMHTIGLADEEWSAVGR